MFKLLSINEQAKSIDGLPKGWITIFLADVTRLFGSYTHCAVICPEALLPKEGQFYSSIIGAKVVLFNNKEFTTIDVTKGHKIRKGGCTAIFQSRYSGLSEIYSYDGEHHFEHRPIRPDNVLVVL